jgi:large subunit ribosomal protein L20
MLRSLGTLSSRVSFYARSSSTSLPSLVPLACNHAIQKQCVVGMTRRHLSLISASSGGRIASGSLIPRISPFTTPLSRGLKQKHKKFIKLAKGFLGRGNRCYKMAKNRVDKARQYAYRDRKVKKRDFRTLWIQRVNAASRIYGVTYNNLINQMSRSNIRLNRKSLSELAFNEPLSFRSVVEVIKQNQVATKVNK